MATDSHFTIIDYIVSIASLVVCLVAGGYYAHRSPNTNEDLLVGGRTMKILPISASIMVSFFSTITILGYPAEIYAFGIEIFMQAICQCIGIVLSALIMVPFFYPMKLTSIYAYLQLRYDSVILRRIGALIFIVEQTALAAMILYAPSIVLESFLGVPLWLSIFGVGLCGTVYTSVGGLKAVVWTDTFQFVVMTAGLLGICIKCFMEVGVVPAFSVAWEKGRLNLFDFTVDPFERHNTLNFILGSGVVLFIRTGVHQVQVQRYMSLPNVENAKRAVMLSSPLKFIVMLIMMLTGVALYAVYAECDPVKSGKMLKLDQMVTTFVVEQLSNIPGSLGLFTAAMFSGSLSSLSSQFNSLAAVTWEDFLSETSFFQSMEPKNQANVSRVLSLLYGIIAMLLAFIAQYMGAIYAASFAVTGVTTGAIICIFSMGAFMPFVNKMGASIGTLVAFLFMTFVSALGFIYKSNKIKLPVSTEGCANLQNLTMSVTNADVIVTDEWNGLQRLAGLSYIMYPFAGAVIGIGTALFVSLLTGGFRAENVKAVKARYLHPWVRSLVAKEEEKESQEMNSL